MIYPIKTDQFTFRDIQFAVSFLKKGDVIIYPTDTLYGLGVDATNTVAIKKLNKLKNRKHAYSIIVDSMEMCKQYAFVNSEIEEKIKNLLPGPFTVILKQTKNNLSPLVAPNLNTIGIRMPNSSFIINVVKIII